MKTLSIRQPWAWLIVNGYKDIENRTWNTRYRGEFLVHASARFDKTGYNYVRNKMEIELPPMEQMQTGGIVGKAELVDVVNASENKWFDGPKGYVLKNAEPLTFVPLKGKLNFFEAEYANRG